MQQSELQSEAGADTPGVPEWHALREASRARRRVLALYRGRPVRFCPHALVQQGHDSYVLAFLIKAEVTLVVEKFSSPRRWRWLRVRDLTGILVVAGGWCTGPPATQPVLDAGPVEPTES